MPRRQPDRMPFYKVFSREWLEGSLRVECDSAERGLWADLLSMANESRNRGVIQANEITPYPHSWIAAKLCVSLEFLESTLEKFKAQGRIEENSTGIILVNFLFYQEELYRKKRGRPSRYPVEQLPLEYEPDEAPASISPENREKAAATWKEVLAALKTQVSPANFRTFLQSTAGLAIDKGVFYISVPARSIAEYLHDNQRSMIARQVTELIGEDTTVKFVVERKGERGES